MAETCLLRAIVVGADPGAADVASRAVRDLHATALHAAGAGEATASLRARARYGLAWQYAAEGDTRAALMELAAADYEAARGPAAVSTSSATPVSRRGNVLRRLGRHAEAERCLAAALDGTPVRTSPILCDLARLHAATGDVDAAAAALEDAFLTNHAHGLAGRQPRVLAVRALLPDCQAVRQLDAVMRG